jgi:predicted amino acid-binding ACT domain protein
MLLCREKNDYTLFDFNGNDASNFVNDIFECFTNRGVSIVNIEIIDDGVAMEIWVKRPGQMEEVDLYYLFPADQMVIEY